MKKPRSLGFLFVVAALVAAIATVLASQRQETMALRGELELARLEKAELEQLRVENQRLNEKQIPAAALETLRADHAALPRLRAELEALKKHLPTSP